MIRPVNQILYKPNAVVFFRTIPAQSSTLCLRTPSSGAVDVNDEDGAVGVGVEDFVADAAQQE